MGWAAARAFFSAAGFAPASADSTAAFCRSASSMNGANFSGRLGGHAGTRPTRLAAAGARRWPAQVCSSRRFQPSRWSSGSSPASSANRAAIAPACSFFAGSNSSWIRAAPTADAPAYAARAKAPAASVICAGSPPRWRAQGSPDSTSLRAIAPRRGSVTRSPAPMNRCPMKGAAMPASSRAREAARRAPLGTRRSQATSIKIAPASPCATSSFCSSGGAVRAVASAARAPVSRWRSSRRYSSRFFHSPARFCRSVPRMDI